MNVKEFMELLPEYPGESTLHLTGSGRAEDASGETGEECPMALFENTDRETFLRYIASLIAAGFEKEYDRTETYGVFGAYRKEGMRLYLYYLDGLKQTRIIWDRVSAPTDKFCADDTPQTRADTEFCQFGLYYSDMIRWRSSDCGMSYMIRLHNNKLIIVDGGIREQATEAAVGEFMLQLRRMTSTYEGDIITIACWYCTHMHCDHMEFFQKLLHKFGAVLKVERVLFNFPDPAYEEQPECLPVLKEDLKNLIPDALYLKPHTGQKLMLDNAEIDILMTHEDVINASMPTGHYPGWLNSTSTVVRIRFENKSVILLGDSTDNSGEVFNAIYRNADLSCDYLQAAHHCINHVRNIYSVIKADTILIPESRYNIWNRFKSVYNTICGFYNERNFHLAGDYTVNFSCKDNMVKTSYYPVVGFIYDCT